MHLLNLSEISKFSILNRVTLKIYEPYHIILNLIMFFTGSTTFHMKDLILYGIRNASKMTVSTKKLPEKVNIYIHLIDCAQLINLEFCKVLLYKYVKVLHIGNMYYFTTTTLQGTILQICKGATYW